MANLDCGPNIRGHSADGPRSCSRVSRVVLWLGVGFLYRSGPAGLGSRESRWARFSGSHVGWGASWRSLLGRISPTPQTPLVMAGCRCLVDEWRVDPGAAVIVLRLLHRRGSHFPCTHRHGGGIWLDCCSDHPSSKHSTNDRCWRRRLTRSEVRRCVVLIHRYLN